MHLGSFLSLVGRQVKEFFGRLSRGQIVRLAVLAVLVIAIAIVASMLFGGDEYTMVYSNAKDEAATAAVRNSLTASGVDVKVRSGDIWVPTAQAENVRLDMASQGLIGSGGSSYDIYKQSTGLGSTQSEQKQMLNYQLEANIRNTLKSMAPVLDASVMVTQPDVSVFVIERENSKPTASVTLTLRDGATLKNGEVQTIANIVAAAVKDLKPEDVIIADTSPRLYDLNGTVEDDSDTITKQFEMERVVQERFESQIIKLLKPLFGNDNVSVGVNVRLNFDKKQQESTIFSEPVPGSGNNGIVISMKELSEHIRGEDATAGQPGQDTNGGLPVYPYTEGDAGDDPYYRYERETNMEVNSIKSFVDMAEGRIEQLTASVAIRRQEGAEDLSSQVSKLVQNALGIKEKSAITVTQMPFIEPDTSAQEAQAKLLADTQRNDLIKLAIIVVAALIVCIFLIKLLRDIFKPKAQAVAAAPQHDEEPYDLPEDAVEGVDYVIDEDGNIVPIVPDPVHYEVERKRNEKQEFIEKLIDEDPETAAQLLRSWLIDE